MASIYKNSKNYYLSVRYNGKQLAKSLGTDDEQVVESLQSLVKIEYTFIGLSIPFKSCSS